MFKELIWHYLEVNSIENPFGQVHGSNQENRSIGADELYPRAKSALKIALT